MWCREYYGDNVEINQNDIKEYIDTFMSRCIYFLIFILIKRNINYFLFV
ncbi:hypothetical protein [[Clostridium] colinum]|nr:hypothetical protein [[Clostridium] colinum]